MKRATATNGRAIEAGRRSPVSASLSPESNGREIVAEIVNGAVERAMFGEGEKPATDEARTRQAPGKTA